MDQLQFVRRDASRPGASYQVTIASAQRLSLDQTTCRITLPRSEARGAFHSDLAILVYVCVTWLFCGSTNGTADDSIPATPAAVTQSSSPVEKKDDAEGIRFFESKIRPVLVENCYQCHSAAKGQSKGGLQLDTRSGIRRGGDRGPAIVPQDVQASLLLRAISHADADLKMPPRKERLSESVLQDLRRWVEIGAPDPRIEITDSTQQPLKNVAGRQFWSFQKPVASPLPAVKHEGWILRELDRFVLSRLEASGMAPSDDADASTLLRRVHFDLVGLPPTPQAIDQFHQRMERDGLDKALTEEVDALLKSPQFGERWGRHWLDVARYAESSGKEANMSFPYAFRYRDYVIDAFNADIPFNRFLIEQIAGDLLPFNNDADRARLLIATGFLALGPKNLDEANPKQFEADLIDEQIDAVTRAFMASSIACARCHDHKFDPYSMQDYYALAGIFTSTKTFFGTYVTPTNRMSGDPLVLPLGANQPIFHASISPQQVVKDKNELMALKKEQERGMAAVMKAALKGEDTEKVFTLRDALRIFWTVGRLEGQLEKVDESGKALPLAMGVLDRPEIVDAPLLSGGEVDRPGPRQPRGVPKVIELATARTMPTSQSGRLQLAHWLADPDHPLTARVMSNRVWKHLMGSGLVRTVDNFGTSGERPTHPELLDHLAISFVKTGWSVKHLVREIILSRTYRQSSRYRREAFQQDPENRLYWRHSKRRLEAEAIRDSMLVTSGELNSERPSGSLVAIQIGDHPISLIGLNPKLPRDLDGSVHRSVYLPVIRDRLPDVLELFDFAEPSLVTGERETTNVPVQALYLMNGPFVRSRAKALAQRLLNDVGDDQSNLIRRGFLLAYGRNPETDELRVAKEFFESEQLEIQQRGQLSQDHESTQNLVNFCHALLCTAEFRNLD